VARQVVRNHTVAASDVLVFEQVTPLVVVAAGRVLTDERPSRPVLQEEDLVLATHHVDRYVVPGHRRESCHLTSPFVQWFHPLCRGSNKAHQLKVPDDAA